MASQRTTCAHCDLPLGPRASNPFYPFCSKRCRMADLGAWFGEEYRVPGPPAPVPEPSAFPNPDSDSDSDLGES